ncbi:LysR family transcriptional regulator, partial [Escherichia coli O8,155:H11]
MERVYRTDLKLLRYFLAVAEELHFGRAAARLNMSQPPLSIHIKELENQLGTQLFIRHSRSVVLTHAGKILMEESRRLLVNAKEGANKQVISSQADSLIKISRIWADFFPANTSNRP